MSRCNIDHINLLKLDKRCFKYGYCDIFELEYYTHQVLVSEKYIRNIVQAKWDARKLERSLSKKEEVKEKKKVKI